MKRSWEPSRMIRIAITGYAWPVQLSYFYLAAICYPTSKAGPFCQPCKWDRVDVTYGHNQYENDHNHNSNQITTLLIYNHNYKAIIYTETSNLQAASHSASLGNLLPAHLKRRWCCQPKWVQFTCTYPTRNAIDAKENLQNAWASFQLTWTTGWSLLPSMLEPGPSGCLQLAPCRTRWDADKHHS